MSDLEQHFLTDPEALAWLVAELGPQPGERVVELGAGAGTIALALSRTVAAGDLTLVEVDPRLAASLRQRFAGARVLAEDWRRAWRRLPPPDVLVVSLPHALVPAALAAAAHAPPRVAVFAVAADDPPRLPRGLLRTATRPLPPASFTPPQPFDAIAWVVRPASGGWRAAADPERSELRPSEPQRARRRRRSAAA